MTRRVVVGLSGGVDSSVAAFLLKEQGFDVIGLFMRNWNDKTGVLTGSCSWEDDVMFAEATAKKLGIPFHFTDLSDDYTKRVVEYMFSEYEKGRTPNPDILCNREIKFDSFVKEALNLGADFLATGHYCRKEEITLRDKKIYRLLAGLDPNKDQSYFLCQLSQHQLEKALFPIGHLLKPKVREIAADQKLITATRKDSQGICFVGKVDLPLFLQQKLKTKEGVIIEIPENTDKIYKPIIKIGNFDADELKLLTNPYQFSINDGLKVGTHDGAHFFTIGQRGGLNVGGKPKPLYVLATDIDSNTVYTGQGNEHPSLMRKGLFINANEIHWIRPDLEMKTNETRKQLVRIRYRQPLQPATLIKKEEGLYIIFDELQRGITAGQFAAWYNDDELVGSGVISA